MKALQPRNEIVGDLKSCAAIRRLSNSRVDIFLIHALLSKVCTELPKLLRSGRSILLVSFPQDVILSVRIYLCQYRVFNLDVDDEDVRLGWKCARRLPGLVRETESVIIHESGSIRIIFSPIPCPRCNDISKNNHAGKLVMLRFDTLKSSSCLPEYSGLIPVAVLLNLEATV